MNEEQIKLIQLLGVKEKVLSMLIAWLKAKNLWGVAKIDLGIREEGDIIG